MKTYVECVPCLARQALDAARRVSDDEAVHDLILREVLKAIARADYGLPPPVLGGVIHRIAREVSGIEDPYQEAKEESNRIALAMYPELEQRVRASKDPLETALRVAVAGNVIDFAVQDRVDAAKVAESIEECMTASISSEVVSDLRTAADRAREILYLGDNAGEIVFDRLLIERLPKEKTAFVTRGRPAINDVTRADAEVAGIDELVEVLDNGSDIPGTVLSECSASFRRRFEKADLIISKGQGNYECLSDDDHDIFFIFRAKCPAITKDTGVPPGGIVIRRRPRTF
jgi:uncharacterized protein with ATP-grasp and redox domains